MVCHPAQVAVAEFSVPGEPVSKARPRVTRHGTYTPERVKHAEELVAWHFRLAARRHVAAGDPLYGLEVVFHLWNQGRRDLDNLIKLVLDGLNGVAWLDDSQVNEIKARKQRAATKDLACTDVLVYRTG